MGRKLRVDFSNETVSDEDGGNRDGGVWHKQTQLTLLLHPIH